MARPWGFWTEGKLDILRDYLDAFTTTTRNKASHRLYFDLFAGGSENIQKYSGELIPGSPEIALSTYDPPFTALRFFEKERSKVTELRNYLQERFPGRDFIVYEGDCNEHIHSALERLAHLDWAPAFAFLDPTGPHYKWTTLEAPADFKSESRTKMELWMLFPEPMFVRFLRTDGGKVDPGHVQMITDMYGTDIWREIYQRRLLHKIKPAEARTEYVNLMRLRLQKVLGYEWTHVLDVHNEQSFIYQLVFATDHKAGHKIMSHLYEQALNTFPQMREHAINQRRGTPSLFEESIGWGEIRYVHEPPWKPSW